MAKNDGESDSAWPVKAALVVPLFVTTTCTEPLIASGGVTKWGQGNMTNYTGYIGGPPSRVGQNYFDTTCANNIALAYVLHQPFPVGACIAFEPPIKVHHDVGGVRPFLGHPQVRQGHGGDRLVTKLQEPLVRQPKLAGQHGRPAHDFQGPVALTDTAAKAIGAGLRNQRFE